MMKKLFFVFFFLFFSLNLHSEENIMILKTKYGDVEIKLGFLYICYSYLSFKDLIVLFVVNFFISPFNLTISLTNLDEII